MALTSPLARQLEFELLASDVVFFAGLAVRPELESIRSIGLLALMPFAAATVVEGVGLVERGRPSSQIRLNHEELLRTSRLRLKVLDDDAKGFDEILREASAIAAASTGLMMKLHRGWAAWKRLIQPDLGVYLVANRMICTTHTAAVNIGLRSQATQRNPAAASFTFETLGRHMYAVSVQMGQFFGAVLSALQIDPAPASFGPPPNLAIESRDTSSGRFYSSVGRNLRANDRATSLLVTLMVSQTNSARLLIPVIASFLNTDSAALRLRFLSVFHVTSSLQKLVDRHHLSAILQPAAVSSTQAALRTADVRRIRRLRGLRNIFMHYRVPQELGRSLRADLPLRGVVEAAGGSFGDFVSALDQSEMVISDLLEGFVSEAVGRSRLTTA